MHYRIEWRTSAGRALRKLDPPVARRIASAVSALAADPRPTGVKALTGLPGALRLRVGDWRVIYTVDDGALVVLVVDLGHRRDVYRSL